jgi:3-phosphoshikimate 1-carboxyvinyltransferase
MAAESRLRELRIAGPAKSLRGRVEVPGDKSISHRALVVAALAKGRSRLTNVLRAGVTQAMEECLRQLGTSVEATDRVHLTVEGQTWREPARWLDCDNSGSTMRMLLGALAGQPLRATLTGTARLQQRPMERVVEPLRSMGARIEGASANATPPLTIHGGRLTGKSHRMSVASAQVKTALLLAGLLAEGPTRIEEPGPSRDHTERLLRHLGVSLSISPRTVTLHPDQQALPPFELEIPGDFSSAAFVLVAACLAPNSRVIVENVGINPTRTGLLDALQGMGASIQVEPSAELGGEPVGTIAAEHGHLRGVEVYGTQVVRMIDEFPIFAVAATQAEGETVVRDAHELHTKESDRIADLVEELRKMGARIEARGDGFHIDGPARLHGAHVDSHGDHRLGMALAVAALVAEGETHIDSAWRIDDSFPGFASVLAHMGADVR